MLKNFIILLLTFFVVGFATSQSKLNESLGKVTDIDKNKAKQQFTFHTSSSIAEVSILTPTIFRVRIARSFGEDQSYAVVGEMIRGNFDYGEDADYFFISTDSLDLEIQKSPLRLTFKNKHGQIISQDDPAFGTSWIGNEVTTYKTLQEGEKFLGLGEKTGHLDRRGEGYTNWNTDNPHYDSNSDPLYATIPFYIGLHHGLSYGIFMDNSYRSTFNFGASNDRFSYFSAVDGEMDYYFIGNSTVGEIIESYTWLTGRMEMPPLWALGYQQCRWSYSPDSEVLNIAQTFRKKKIPADVIYLDIGYMDAYKIFTWHPEHFSNPAKLLTDLKNLNFKTAVIVDPGIKVEEGYSAYEKGLAENLFVKYPDGQPWTAQVWPGWCHFPDFTKPEARLWWGENFEEYVKLGIAGFWNDMNEVSSWGQEVPSLLTFDWEGEKTSYREAKNVYGLQMARATYEGTKKLMNGLRPMNITRAGYAGLQRYTAIWTGDNQANEEHLMLGVRLVNSLGLSGVSFTGSDVGGFGGNATPELFARWVQIGAFTPFFRSHTAINTASAEPWAFGEQTERIARNYIQLRYNLLPYIYTAMRQSTLTGMPLNRSLAIDYTSDEKVFWRIYETQYLFGSSMLVIPVESKKEITKAYLPQGGWYDFYTDHFYEGKQEMTTSCPIDKLPVFVKAGSMIAMQSPIQHTAEKPSDTLRVHLYRSNATADHEWEYYEDDGTSYKYKDGDYYLRTMKYKAAINEVVFDKKTGSRKSQFGFIQLVFHGFDNPEFIKVNGETKKINAVMVNFQKAAEEPLPADYYTLRCPSITYTNSEEQIIVNW